MAKKRSVPSGPEVPPRPWTAQDDAFLDAIRAEPNDDTHRLVYADWLTDQGDPWGEVIRLQCQLAKTPCRQRGRREVRVRCEKLLRRHGPRSMAGLRGNVPGACRQTWADIERQIRYRQESPRGITNEAFRRGFVETVSFHLVAFRASGGQMLRQHPIWLIRLRQRAEATAEDACLLADCPQLGGVRRLELEPLAAGLSHIVLDSPHWTRLVTLVVPETYSAYAPWPVDALVEELSESAALARLKTFGVGGNLLRAESLWRLLTAPHFALEKLDLAGRAECHPDPGGPGIENYADASTTSFHPAVSSAAVEAIARSPRAASLRILDVHYNGLSATAIRALLDSPYLNNLEKLYLDEPESGVLSAFLPELRQRFPLCYAP